MDTQAAYEAIRSNFAAPGAKLAKDEMDYGGERCQYLTQGGDKCAVGCLLPDDLYRPVFEGNNVQALLDEHPLLLGYFWNVDKTFLSRAQRLHDVHAKDAAKLVELLDLLALAHGLTVADGTWF